MGQTTKIGKHKTRVIHKDDGSIEVIYHQTCVVKVLPDRSVVLNSGGWETVPTKTRMNQAACELGLGFGVFQRKGNWYVTIDSIPAKVLHALSTGESEAELPFYDGMIIPARA